MAVRLDISGERFGHLVVLRAVRLDTQRDTMWECRCDCGTVKTIAGRHLKSGRTVACGCQRGLKPRHGHKPASGSTPIYESWCNMKRRCLDPTHKRYPDWGGRGITVCDRWRNSFEAFLADMGPKPRGYTLDRIDNNGPYSPENCRWASAFQQRHNRREPRLITIGDTSLTIAGWANLFGVKPTTVHRRLETGWSIDLALSKADRRVRHGKRSHRVITRPAG